MQDSEAALDAATEAAWFSMVGDTGKLDLPLQSWERVNPKTVRIIRKAAKAAIEAAARARAQDKPIG